MLTRTDFEGAVKDALRHHPRADLLVGNPLLRSRVMEQRGGVEAPTPQDLRVMLAKAAADLFANARDQKLYRVLDLTYFNPAPKQEAAADRLGLPFSTYRRYLTTGVNRITDWLWQQEQGAPDAGASARTPEAETPITGRRLSIVVLPFLNLSQDPGVDYLVCGIVDSLITDLSRALPGSFVISRSTSFAYKGRQIAARQIGQELGVRYVLEGSVLADARYVRVNAQLIDVQTDEHLWAERFDKERRDVLQVQDEIVGRLSRSVGIEMIRKEAGRDRAGSAGGADAVDLVMRAEALATDIRQQENATQAVSLFRRALELDPGNVEAMVGIAATGIYQVMNLYRTDARTCRLDEAEGLIGRALALAPDHIGVLRARAALLRARGRFAEAIVANQAVIERNPGEPTAYREMGLNRLYLGATEEAAEWFRRADRTAPLDPVRWTWLQGLGRALLQMGRDAEAVEVLRMTIDHNPGYARYKALLAAAEALAGAVQDARLHLAEYLATEPGMTVRRFAEERSSVPLDVVSPVYLRENQRILGGLRRAGMPDE